MSWYLKKRVDEVTGHEFISRAEHSGCGYMEEASGGCHGSDYCACSECDECPLESSGGCHTGSCPAPHPVCPYEDMPRQKNSYAQSPEPPACGTQVTLDGAVTIPDCKPDAQIILRFSPECKVTNWQVTSPHGKRKIVASGIVAVDAEYVADLPEQTVHFLHFTLPFRALFDSKHAISDVACEVEYVDHQLVDKRTISKIIILNVWGVAGQRLTHGTGRY